MSEAAVGTQYSLSALPVARALNHERSPRPIRRATLPAWRDHNGSVEVRVRGMTNGIGLLCGHRGDALLAARSSSSAPAGTLRVMPRDALEIVLEQCSPHRFGDRIPAELRPWLLPIDWNRERLWSLDGPLRRIRLDELRWHLALPWWRHDGAWFQLTPRDVRARPFAYPEHAGRVVRADLSYPLHVVRRRDRWLILDGIHRLTKAAMLGYDDARVVTLRPTDILAIACAAA